jgi:hypothetical protein
MDAMRYISTNLLCRCDFVPSEFVVGVWVMKQALLPIGSRVL